MERRIETAIVHRCMYRDTGKEDGHYYIVFRV